jgi:hypothetical protein
MQHRVLVLVMVTDHKNSVATLYTRRSIHALGSDHCILITRPLLVKLVLSLTLSTVFSLDTSIHLNE